MKRTGRKISVESQQSVSPEDDPVRVAKSSVRRQRYSMNYQSYEPTRIQPIEQTRRMLDYLFPGYQQRDPRNWYEMEVQTDLSGDEAESLVGTEFVERDIPDMYTKKPRSTNFSETLAPLISEESTPGERVQRPSLAPHGWIGPPIKIQARLDENLMLAVEDVYHVPKTLTITKEMLEKNDVYLNITPGDKFVPNLAISVGEREIYPLTPIHDHVVSSNETSPEKGIRYRGSFQKDEDQDETISGSANSNDLEVLFESKQGQGMLNRGLLERITQQVAEQSESETRVKAPMPVDQTGLEPTDARKKRSSVVRGSFATSDNSASTGEAESSEAPQEKKTEAAKISSPSSGAVIMEWLRDGDKISPNESSDSIVDVPKLKGEPSYHGSRYETIDADWSDIKFKQTNLTSKDSRDIIEVKKVRPTDDSSYALIKGPVPAFDSFMIRPIDHNEDKLDVAEEFIPDIRRMPGSLNQRHSVEDSGQLPAPTTTRRISSDLRRNQALGEVETALPPRTYVSPPKNEPSEGSRKSIVAPQTSHRVASRSSSPQPSTSAARDLRQPTLSRPTSSPDPMGLEAIPEHDDEPIPGPSVGHRVSPIKDKSPSPEPSKPPEEPKMTTDVSSPFRTPSLSVIRATDKRLRRPSDSIRRIEGETRLVSKLGNDDLFERPKFKTEPHQSEIEPLQSEIELPSTGTKELSKKDFREMDGSLDQIDEETADQMSPPQIVTSQELLLEKEDSYEDAIPYTFEETIDSPESTFQKEPSEFQSEKKFKPPAVPPPTFLVTDEAMRPLSDHPEVDSSTKRPSIHLPVPIETKDQLCNEDELLSANADLPKMSLRPLKQNDKAINRYQHPLVDYEADKQGVQSPSVLLDQNDKLASNADSKRISKPRREFYSLFGRSKTSRRKSKMETEGSISSDLTPMDAHLDFPSNVERRENDQRTDQKGRANPIVLMAISKPPVLPDDEVVELDSTVETRQESLRVRRPTTDTRLSMANDNKWPTSERKPIRHRASIARSADRFTVDSTRSSVVSSRATPSLSSNSPERSTRTSLNTEISTLEALRKDVRKDEKVNEDEVLSNETPPVDLGVNEKIATDFAEFIVSAAVEDFNRHLKELSTYIASKEGSRRPQKPGAGIPEFPDYNELEERVTTQAVKRPYPVRTPQPPSGGTPEFPDYNDLEQWMNKGVRLSRHEEESVKMEEPSFGQHVELSSEQPDYPFDQYEGNRESESIVSDIIESCLPEESSLIIEPTLPIILPTTATHISKLPGGPCVEATCPCAYKLKRLQEILADSDEKPSEACNCFKSNRESVSNSVKPALPRSHPNPTGQPLNRSVSFLSHYNEDARQQHDKWDSASAITITHHKMRDPSHSMISTPVLNKLQPSTQDDSKTIYSLSDTDYRLNRGVSKEPNFFDLPVADDLNSWPHDTFATSKENKGPPGVRKVSIKTEGKVEGYENRRQILTGLALVEISDPSRIKFAAKKVVEGESESVIDLSLSEENVRQTLRQRRATPYYRADLHNISDETLGKPSEVKSEDVSAVRALFGIEQEQPSEMETFQVEHRVHSKASYHNIGVQTDSDLDEPPTTIALPFQTDQKYVWISVPKSVIRPSDKPKRPRKVCPCSNKTSDQPPARAALAQTSLRSIDILTNIENELQPIKDELVKLRASLSQILNDSQPPVVAEPHRLPARPPLVRFLRTNRSPVLPTSIQLMEELMARSTIATRPYRSRIHDHGYEVRRVDSTPIFASGLRPPYRPNPEDDVFGREIKRMPRQNKREESLEERIAKRIESLKNFIDKGSPPT